METPNHNQTNENRNLNDQVSDTPNSLLALFDPKSVDEALFMKCKVHSDLDCDFIVILKNAECSRVCMKCMREKEILFSNIISIRQLLFANPQPLLSRYPVLINQEVQIKELRTAKGIRDALLLQINDYKKSFNDLLNAINSKKKLVNQEISQMEKSYKELMVAYENISNINEFKRIVVKNNSEDETELKSFVNAHCEQSEANSMCLDKKIAEFKHVWSDFSVDLHQEDFNSIILKINSFKFLSWSPKLSQSQSTEEQTIEGEITNRYKSNEKVEQKQSQELCSLSQQLKQFPKNQEQERQLKDEKTTQLESQVHTLQEEVKSLNEQIADLFSNLKACEQQSKQKEDLLGSMDKQKEQLQMDMNDLKQIQSAQNLMSAIQGKEADILIRQIKYQEKCICQYFNQTNEIKDKVQQLASIMPTNNKSKTQERYPEQLAQVNKEFQELEENVKVDQEKTKDNIKLLKQQLENLNQQSDEFENLHTKMQKISELLFQVNNEQIDILPRIQLLPSNKYKNSKDLEIIHQQYRQIIVKIQKSLFSSSYSQCYFNNPLEQDKKYIIRVQLNGTNQVALGLISQEEKDKSPVQNFYMFYSELNGGTCNTIVKGKLLNSRSNPFKQEKCIEIRISLRDNIFKIGDYPGYLNVNQLENTYAYRMKYSNYYFAIWLSSESGTNEVKVLDVYKINQFDQKM